MLASNAAEAIEVECMMKALVQPEERVFEEVLGTENGSWIREIFEGRKGEMQCQFVLFLRAKKDTWGRGMIVEKQVNPIRNYGRNITPW